MRLQKFAFAALTALVISATPAMSASAAPINLHSAHALPRAAAADSSVTNVGGTIVTTTVPVTTPAQLAAFEASNTPKVITIDTATNQVATVTQS